MSHYHQISRHHTISQDCALVLSQEALAERNEEKNIAELLVVSDEKADSDCGRKKKISGRSDEIVQKRFRCWHHLRCA